MAVDGTEFYGYVPEQQMDQPQGGGGALRFQVYELAAERERLCISASFSAAF
jgi:hypothetical protein